MARFIELGPGKFAGTRTPEDLATQLEAERRMNCALLSCFLRAHAAHGKWRGRALLWCGLAQVLAASWVLSYVFGAR